MTARHEAGRVGEVKIAKRLGGGDANYLTDAVLAQSKIDDVNASQNRRPRIDSRNGKIRYAKLWITEMRGRVGALSPLARGAYFMLLFEYLNRQQPLPDDEKLLRRISGVDKVDWDDIRTELLTVMDLVDGNLNDEYAERCIAEFRDASKRGKSNVRLRYAVVGGLKDVGP